MGQGRRLGRATAAYPKRRAGRHPAGDLPEPHHALVLLVALSTASVTSWDSRYFAALLAATGVVAVISFGVPLASRWLVRRDEERGRAAREWWRIHLESAGVWSRGATTLVRTYGPAFLLVVVASWLYHAAGASAARQERVFLVPSTNPDMAVIRVEGAPGRPRRAEIAVATPHRQRSRPVPEALYRVTPEDHGAGRVSSSPATATTRPSWPGVAHWPATRRP